MPKQKTHKGIAKRFRVSARGKVMHGKAGKRHLLSHKSSKRRRILSTTGQATGADAALIRKALGEG